jgi:hypothetical protein
MKSDYLQLFMDRDLALKFVEDKEREIEEFCYHLSVAHSSSLTARKTPSYLAVVTHEIMSGTLRSLLLGGLGVVAWSGLPRSWMNLCNL